MKHARPDYDRFQDPAGLIPEQEPVFLLRAQDVHAWRAVRFYHDLLMSTLKPELVEMAKLSLEQARAMEAWQPKKDPDLPPVEKTKTE